MPKNKRAARVQPEIELMTVEDLAMSLRVSVRSVWRQVSQGKLPRPVYVGNLARWPVAAVQSWLKQEFQDNHNPE